jgi:hypothetical protein
MIESQLPWALRAQLGAPAHPAPASAFDDDSLRALVPGSQVLVDDDGLAYQIALGLEALGIRTWRPIAVGDPARSGRALTTSVLITTRRTPRATTTASRARVDVVLPGGDRLKLRAVGTERTGLRLVPDAAQAA